MKYYVVTPAYATYFGMSTWEQDYGSDVVEVEAPTKRRAKVLGLRELRRIRSQWLLEHEGNPFKGLKVHETGA